MTTTTEIIDNEVYDVMDYGEVINETTLYIFGGEMLYNDLKFYARNTHETTYLEVKQHKYTVVR